MGLLLLNKFRNTYKDLVLLPSGYIQVMFVLFTVIVFSLDILKAIDPLLVEPEPREYCKGDYFNVSCGHNEVIMMKSAEYGRMNEGKCISKSFGDMNCKVNVMQYMDWKCSGRRKCEVYIEDPVLHDLQTQCPRDLTSYLEASHQCLPVAHAHGCRDSDGLLLTSTVGYISSAYTISTIEYGTRQCPWKIRVKPGQTIEISLFTFTFGKSTNNFQSNASPNSRGPCYEVGDITEGRTTATITACSGQHISNNVFYQSKSNEIIIELRSKTVLEDFTPFVIRYKAQGCPQYKAPTGGWVTIEDDTAVVRCNKTQETWYLTCDGNTWIGQSGNCSNAQASVYNKDGGGSLIDEANFPVGILIVVAIGVALGVFCGGILLSIVAMYMKPRKKNGERPYHPEEVMYQEQDIKQQTPTNQTSFVFADGTHSIVYADKQDNIPDEILCKTGTGKEQTVYHGCPPYRSPHFYESPRLHP